MALALAQVVLVRVAVVLTATDESVGQVFDQETGQWADVVWIDLANSTALPLEFGEVDFWCEVSSLSLVRSGIDRPAVVLRAWQAGVAGEHLFEIIANGPGAQNQARLLYVSGASVTTTLPGLGVVANLVRIRGFRDQRVGWTGRIPSALSWDRANLAIRKRVRYGADAFADAEYLSGQAFFRADLTNFNLVLAAALPEYGSAITVGATVEFTRAVVSGTTATRSKHVAVFTIHCLLSGDASVWVWTARGARLGVSSTDSPVVVCGGATPTRFSGQVYGTASANVAVNGATSHSPFGVFTTPTGSAGLVTASPRAAFFSGGPTYGLDLAITVAH